MARLLAALRLGGFEVIHELLIGAEAGIAGCHYRVRLVHGSSRFCVGHLDIKGNPLFRHHAGKEHPHRIRYGQPHGFQGFRGLCLYFLNYAKGYFGNKSKLFRYAKEAVHHAWLYAFRARRKKKGDFRSIWIVRLNAAARANGISYSRLIEGLKAANIQLDRKVLSDLAIRDEVAFTGLVAKAQDALKAKAAAKAA